MVITAEQLRREFDGIWPDLKHVWLRNKTYFRPSLAELIEVLNAYITDIPFQAGFMECENYALFLHADIKKQWVLRHPEGGENWAFGDFIAERANFFGGPMIHSACICLTSDSGFQIIEPMQKNRVIPADPGKYRIFFANLN